MAGNKKSQEELLIEGCKEMAEEKPFYI